MKRISLTPRQRMILQSALLDWWCGVQPSPFADILAALAKAGLLKRQTISEIALALAEHKRFVEHWSNRVLKAAGVTVADLWGTDEPASAKQERTIETLLGCEVRGLSFLEAKALLQVLNGHRKPAGVVVPVRNGKPESPGALGRKEPADKGASNERGVSGVRSNAGAAADGGKLSGSVAGETVPRRAAKNGQR